MIDLHARVRLLTDAHAAHGVSAGALGYVIERHGTSKYEIEFSDVATGITRAQLVVDEAELVADPEPLADGGIAPRRR